MTASIGHNGGPTFDDIVRDNKDRGLLLTMKEVIVEAVRDPRLDRRHLRVLAEVIAAINSSSGMAYPGHKAIAESLRRYNVDGYRDQGYSDQVIRNTLSDLVSFGYLVSERRAAEKGGRALAHYSIRKPTREELQQFITDYIMASRTAPPRPHPAAQARRASPDVTRRSDVERYRDVTSEGDVTAADVILGSDITREPDVTRRSDVIKGSDVTSAGDITSTSSDTKKQKAQNIESDVTLGSDVTYRSDVTCDVTSPVGTVTSSRELGERTDIGASGSEAGAGPDETHVGHGVFVNGQTIRHKSFAISLPGVQMGTLTSGLTANEVRDHCVAHALQWAAEIEIGKSPRDVLPSKIANFLSRSIMGAVNQQKIQAVRAKREEHLFAGRGRGSLPDGIPQESELERTKRLLAGG